MWLSARKKILFQHTAARRRLGEGNLTAAIFYLFQHTAARRRLVAGRSIYLIE